MMDPPKQEAISRTRPSRKVSVCSNRVLMVDRENNFTLCACGKNMNIHISNDITAGNHRSTGENNVEQVLHALTHSIFSLVADT